MIGWSAAIIFSYYFAQPFTVIGCVCRAMICRVGLYVDFYKITVLGLFSLSRLICKISLYAGIYDSSFQPQLHGLTATTAFNFFNLTFNSHCIQLHKYNWSKNICFSLEKKDTSILPSENETNKKQLVFLKTNRFFLEFNIINTISKTKTKGWNFKVILFFKYIILQRGKNYRVFGP